jgi:hypothetical protein
MIKVSLGNLKKKIEILSLAFPALKFLTNDAQTDRLILIHLDESKLSTNSWLQATF